MNGIPACNPQLKTWRRNIAATVAGAGHIEVPGRFQNVVWQSRPEVPGEYELALAAALESVFDAGAVEVADIIAGLNQRGLQDRHGQAWTEASFRSEMAALA